MILETNVNNEELSTQKDLLDLIQIYINHSHISNTTTNNINEDVSKDDHPIYSIIENMIRHEISIQDMISLLEPYLTSEQDKERNKSTSLLAELLDHNNTYHISTFAPSVLHLFIVFLTHRLADFPSILPSLQALVAIIENYGDDLDPKYCDAIDIFQAICRDIHVPSYAQNVRQKVFYLLHILLLNTKIVETLQSMSNSSSGYNSGSNSMSGSGMGVEILDGIVNCMEEEKDPRCLLASLQLIYQAIQCFPHSMIDILPSVNAPICIKIFDATSCYFPITFSPPPDDPFGITPESLITALQDCLCAHESMLYLVVPFLMEQLTSDAMVARIHSVQVLLQLVSIYKHQAFTMHHKHTNSNNAEMQQLYDMVDDDDDDINDHSHLYVTKNDNSLENNNELKFFYIKKHNAVYLSKLSDILFSMAADESSAELVHSALSLISAISNSVSQYLIQSGSCEDALSDWRSFIDHLMKQVSAEVQSNLSGLRAKASMNIAYTIVRTGDCLLARSVLQYLLPPLMKSCTVASQQIKDVLNRIIDDYCKGIKRVLPSSNQIGASELSLITPLETLSQLVACLNTIDDRTGVDFSELRELDPLGPYSMELFHMLSEFICPHLEYDWNEYSLGSIPVNPFQAVKLLHTTDNNNNNVNMNTAMSNLNNSSNSSNSSDDNKLIDEIAGVTVVVPLPAYVVSCVVNAIYAMREVIVRRINIPEEDIAVYLQQITQLVMYGTPVLLGDHSYKSGSSGESFPPLMIKACQSLLISISAIDKYSTVIMSTHCLDPLIKTLRNNPGAEDLCGRILKILAVIVSEASNVEVISTVTFAIFQQTNSIINSSSDMNIPSAKLGHISLIVRTLCDLLIDESSLNDKKVSVNKLQANERMAQLLLGLHIDDANNTRDFKTTEIYLLVMYILSSIDVWIHSNVSCEDLYNILESIFTFIRRAILSLTQLNEQTNVVKAYIDSILKVYIDSSTIASNQLSKEKYDICIALASNLLMHLDKKSPLFTCNDQPYEELLHRCCSLTLDRYRYNPNIGKILLLPSTIMARTAATTNTSSERSSKHSLFGSSNQLVSILINKIQNIDVLSTLLATILGTFYRYCHGFNVETSQKQLDQLMSTTTSVEEVDGSNVVDKRMECNEMVDLVISTIQSVLMRSDIRYNVSLAIKSNNLLDNDIHQYNNNTAIYSLQCSTTIATWQDYFQSFLLQLLTIPNAIATTTTSTSLVSQTIDRSKLTSFELVLQEIVATKLNLFSDPYNNIAISITRMNYGMLWKQKTWLRFFPLLHSHAMKEIQAYQLHSSTSTNSITTNTNIAATTPILSVLAICTLVSSIDIHIIQTSLQDLVEIVVYAVSFTDTISTEGSTNTTNTTSLYNALKKCSITTLEVLLTHHSEGFIPYLNVIIPALIKTVIESKLAKLRLSAVQCISMVTETIPFTRLYPYKIQIQKGLAKALDDKKRAIRYQAGKVRNKWILMK